VSDSARLFVAVSLPAGVRSELAHWSRAALPARGGVRRLAAEALHLTLCFLGEQPLSAVGELVGVLGAAAEPLASVGELELGPPVWLPPRRPRVLAVEIGDPLGALGDLRRLLAADIATTIDWESGRERFRPHVTVARMPPLPGGERLGEAIPPTPQLSFICDRVALLRSHLEPGGARYEELASVGGW
jgi:2'-5' RNA ligase